MNDNFQEYERMKLDGVDAHAAYLYSRGQGMGLSQQISPVTPHARIR